MEGVTIIKKRKITINIIFKTRKNFPVKYHRNYKHWFGKQNIKKMSVHKNEWKNLIYTKVKKGGKRIYMVHMEQMSWVQSPQY